MVQTIALMHPFYGGEAVYWARAILHLDIIDKLPPMRRAQLQQIQKPKVNSDLDKIFPNPSSNSVTFFSVNNFGKHDLIEIINALNEVVLKFNLPEEENNFTFETSNLPNGIYFVRHFTSTECVSKIKLIIIK